MTTTQIVISGGGEYTYLAVIFTIRGSGNSYRYTSSLLWVLKHAGAALQVEAAIWNRLTFCTGLFKFFAHLFIRRGLLYILRSRYSQCVRLLPIANPMAPSVRTWTLPSIFAASVAVCAFCLWAHGSPKITGSRLRQSRCRCSAYTKLRIPEPGHPDSYVLKSILPM